MTSVPGLGETKLQARGICLTITIRKQKMFSRVENGRKQNFSLDILVGTVSNSVMPQYMVEKIIR